MRLDRVHDAVRLAVPLRVAGGDERVRALLLVGQRLAEVVQKRRPLRRLHSRPELARHDSRQVYDLECVLEHVLAVARTELEPAEDLDELLVELAAMGLEDRLLARLPYQ